MNRPAHKASLGIIFLTVFIDLLGFGMVIPLLPIYAKQFVVDEGGWTIALLMSSFSAMQFVCAPIWGRISDRIGRRPVLIIGLAGSVVFYFLFGLATSYKSLVWLFIARIGAGVSGATISTAQAYIADVTTPEKRARGMALIGAAFGLGFTFGPLLGAVALLFEGEVEVSPWPGYAAAILSGVALILAMVRLPESLSEQSESAARKLLDLAALRAALATPTIVPLLLTSFVTIVSFANLESTMALLLKQPSGGFAFDFVDVLYVFAYVGFVLSFAQGFLVRRLAGRVHEQWLATAGVLICILGFLCLGLVTQQQEKSTVLLLIALGVEVVGFSFMTPSLQSLISRRSDPRQQGGILGVGQSVSSLARIVGPLVGIPLFHVAPALPFWAAAGLMAVALVMVLVSTRGGRDYESSSG
jgi:MFS family permease